MQLRWVAVALLLEMPVVLGVCAAVLSLPVVPLMGLGLALGLAQSLLLYVVARAGWTRREW